MIDMIDILYLLQALVVLAIKGGVPVLYGCSFLILNITLLVIALRF